MKQWRKGIATWEVGRTLYISVPFTWNLEEAEKLRSEHKGPVKIGGPAIGVPTECEGFEPILFHNPCATFTSRGCPNNCGFCVVSCLEPEFFELEYFRPAPIICDNNFLACSVSHIDRVVESVKGYQKVDFQGIDANYVTPEKADLLGKTKSILHIGFDHRNEGKVYDAVKLLQERSTKDIVAYVIIGYQDTPEEAYYRLELARSWGIKPFPMRYQPLDAKKKNSYVAPGWTEKELRKMSRYYSRLNWLEQIPYSEYQVTAQSEMILEGV